MFKNRYFYIGLFFSIFIHFAYFKLLKPIKIEESKVITVDLVKEEQIVDNKLHNNQESETNLLSDQNNKVEKQTINKSDSSPQIEKTITKETEEKKEVTKENTEDLPNKNLESFNIKKKLVEKTPLKESTTKQAVKVEKKVNLFDSDLLNKSLASNDKLDNIASGDVTLLNTKANKFAGFVRRIGIAVFNDIRLNYLRAIRTKNIISYNGSLMFNTKLDSSGNQITNKLIESEIEDIIRDLVKNAIDKNANDANPPKAALNKDGIYDFDFQFRSSKNNDIISFELRIGLN